MNPDHINLRPQAKSRGATQNNLGDLGPRRCKTAELLTKMTITSLRFPETGRRRDIVPSHLERRFLLLLL